MSDSGSGQSGAPFTYQSGVWLSKAEGARNEKYQRWTEDRTKSQVQRLDRQKHSNMVKLNSQCLEVRNELRGLQHDRRQLSRRHGSADSPDSPETQASASLSSASSPGGKILRKSASANSLTSTSSGYSSLGSPKSVPRKAGSREAAMDRGGEGAGVRNKALGPKNLKNPDPAALRLKNLHSARALSKLNNDMDVIH